MAQQYPKDGNKQAHGIANGIKKAVKRLAIVLLCMVAIITVGLGMIIYNGMHPRKSPLLANTFPTSSGQTQDPIATQPDVQEESASIDTPNYDELHTYDTVSHEIPVCLSGEAYERVSQWISEHHAVFQKAEYYALDDALHQYRNRPVKKSTETTLLTDGALDGHKLLQAVIKNNGAVMHDGKNTLNLFYKELSSSDLTRICDEIAKVVNDKSGEFDIRHVANTLEKLTIFQRTGTTSNAYVSTDLTLVYNPIAIESYQTMQEIGGGSSETVWAQVIDHEIMHLIQYSASDLTDDNGLETGFCRKYNQLPEEQKVPVDSLYFSWILEAGAELNMAGYLDIEPGTYQKKISYLRSYHLSRFYQVDTQESALERLSFKHTLEEVFTALGLETEEEKQAFLEFLYSVEITQADVNDFWDYYEAQTGKALTEEEKNGIRMDIRTDAVQYLTAGFFENLALAIFEGQITDLDTAFYLMRTWELDTFNHLNYTQAASLEHAKDFILWYSQLQDIMLTALAESSQLEASQIQSMYDGYHLQLQAEDNEIRDHCDLIQMTDYMQNFILEAKHAYGIANYSRIKDVAQWIEKQALPQDT